MFDEQINTWGANKYTERSLQKRRSVPSVQRTTHNSSALLPPESPQEWLSQNQNGINESLFESANGIFTPFLTPWLLVCSFVSSDIYKNDYRNCALKYNKSNGGPKPISQHLSSETWVKHEGDSIF